MVVRAPFRLAILVLAIGYALPVSAGEIGDFLSSEARDTKRRNCWPEPFNHIDRAEYRQVFALQVAAGWERQTMLSDFHFLPGGTELTEAGRIRVNWIISEVPEAHRQIFVHRADSPQETGIRMQAVQRFVSQSPYANNIPILESTRTDEGWPADRIDLVTKKSASLTPDPKLGAAGGGK
jgi:hypothetical protein